MNTTTTPAQEPAAATPQSVTAPTPPAVPPLPRASKKVLIALAAGAAVLLVGFAWGVYAYVSNLPENMLKAAAQNISSEKTVAATIEIVSGTEGNSSTVTGDIAYTVDPSNNKNGEVIFGLGSGSRRVGLTVLSLDGTAYLKAASLENLAPFLALYSPSLASSSELPAALKRINGQWFELTEQEIQAIAASSGNPSVAGAVSADDVKRVFAIYNQHSFVKVDKILADEVVDGANCAHFTVKVDKAEQVAFMRAVKDANLATIEVTDEDIAKAEDDNSAASANIEVWIARDSKKFKQFRATSVESGKESSMTITLTSALPTFDKFEKPAGAKPFSEITSLLLGQ